jgi:hypothetical protein
MPKSREDRIYLAYKATKAALEKQGLTDRLHGRTLLYLAEIFSVNPLTIQKIIEQRRDKQK